MLNGGGKNVRELFDGNKGTDYQPHLPITHELMCSPGMGEVSSKSITQWQSTTLASYRSWVESFILHHLNVKLPAYRWMV